MGGNRNFDMLIDAIYKNDISAVERILSDGVEVNRCVIQDEGKTHRTPLMIAATFQDSACVELLLANGADPNIRPKNEYTALIHATRNLNANSVRLLLEAKADTRQTDYLNDTPFMHLCRKYQNSAYPVIEVFLDYGDDPNQRNQQGQTPLMLLAKCREIISYSNIDYVKPTDLLIRKGADPELKDDSGNSAVSIAKIFGKSQPLIEHLNNYVEHKNLNETIDNFQNKNKIDGLNF